MVDSIKIEVKGLSELQNRFGKLSKELSDIVEEATRSGADVVTQNAKMKVHVITGRLKESIGELHVNKSNYKTEVQVGSNVPYASVEEFRVGGKYPGPHSYLRWSLDVSKNEVADVMKRKISSQLGRYK